MLPRRLDDYCARAMPAGLPAWGAVELFQRGEIRLAPDKPWLPFRARQIMATGHVEFTWRARFRLARCIPGVVVDEFRDGRGRLDARLLGLIPVARASGEKIDRSEKQRYLAELAWCPMALRQNTSLEFRELTNGEVRIIAGDEACYVDITFDDAGDITRVGSLTRYRDETMQPWEGRFSDYRSWNGVRVPGAAQVAWLTPDGPYCYWRATLDRYGPLSSG